MGTNRISRAMTSIASVSGRCHRNDQEPSLMMSARRRFSSIMPPRMKPSSMGASGKSSSRSATAPTAKSTMRWMSKVLKETKYTPIMEKNRIIGMRIARGTASTRAM